MINLTMPPSFNQQFFSNPAFVALAIIVSIWTMVWKGVALWKAARLDQRNWFVALFILIPINFLAIVELIYLFKFAKKRLTIKEIKGWFRKN